VNRNRKGFIPIILVAVLALVVSVGGVGIGLAWRTEILDKYLPPNIQELFGRGSKPADGVQTNGEQLSDGKEQPRGDEEEPPAEDKTKDWKVYNSAPYSYSIKYPNDWTVSQSTVPSAETESGVEDDELILTSSQGAVVDVIVYTHSYGSIDAFLQASYPQVIVDRLRKLETSGKTSYLDQGDDEGSALWVEVLSNRVLLFRYSGCGAFGCPPGVGREAERATYDLMLGTINVK